MHQTCIIIGKVEWKPAAANMVDFLGSVTSRGLKLVPAVVRCLPLVDGGGTAEEVHHPLPGHRPYISQRFRNLSKSNPTRRHPPLPGYRLTHKPTLTKNPSTKWIRMYPTQFSFQDSSPRTSKKAIPPRINFGLITRVQASVLGVLVAPITLCSSHTFAPTTSHDLGTSLILCGI